MVIRNVEAIDLEAKRSSLFLERLVKDIKGGLIDVEVRSINHIASIKFSIDGKLITDVHLNHANYRGLQLSIGNPDEIVASLFGYDCFNLPYGDYRIREHFDHINQNGASEVIMKSYIQEGVAKSLAVRMMLDPSFRECREEIIDSVDDPIAQMAVQYYVTFAKYAADIEALERILPEIDEAEGPKIEERTLRKWFGLVSKKVKPRVFPSMNDIKNSVEESSLSQETKDFLKKSLSGGRGRDLFEQWHDSALKDKHNLPFRTKRRGRRRDFQRGLIRDEVQLYNHGKSFWNWVESPIVTSVKTYVSLLSDKLQQEIRCKVSNDFSFSSFMMDIDMGRARIHFGKSAKVNIDFNVADADRFFERRLNSGRSSAATRYFTL
tara:strand:- start:1117 stop:2253 length:1137 start_codon:yes stop_codon:yes gene_type:complete